MFTVLAVEANGWTDLEKNFSTRDEAIAAIRDGLLTAEQIAGAKLRAVLTLAGARQAKYGFVTIPDIRHMCGQAADLPYFDHNEMWVIEAIEGASEPGTFGEKRINHILAALRHAVRNHNEIAKLQNMANRNGGKVRVA